MFLEMLIVNHLLMLVICLPLHQLILSWQFLHFLLCFSSPLPKPFASFLLNYVLKHLKHLRLFFIGFQILRLISYKYLLSSDEYPYFGSLLLKRSFYSFHKPRLGYDLVNFDKWHPKYKSNYLAWLLSFHRHHLEVFQENNLLEVQYFLLNYSQMSN